MKELKKISLREEVDKETEQIEKELENRKNLDDIKVTEEMETSLFNRIQDYEYDKRNKVVYHKKKKRYVIAAVAAVLILVFGSTMTSVGSKSYWKVIWDRVAGEEKLSYIDVEKMKSQKTEDLDEVYIFKQIRNELGISTIRLGYMPQKTVLKEYELDKEQKKAVLLYENGDNVIKYSMYMNDSDSSSIQIETDTALEEYQIKIAPGINANVKGYSVKNTEERRFTADFEYKDAQYQLKGIMEKEEMDKILKNLFFYE